MAIVYCRDCVYKKRWADGVGGGCGFKCKSNPKYKRNAITSWFQMYDCESKNVDNTCSEYTQKKKWWKFR